MKTKLVSALAAALLLGACESRPPPRSTSTPRPQQPAAAPLAVLPPPAAAADAGVAEPEPVDTLVLEHDHRAGQDHLARARELKEMADVPGALAEARRALHDAPEDPDALEAVGRYARAAGELAHAAEAYGRLAAASPEDAVPLVHRARALLGMGDATLARAAAEAAVARDAESADAYHLLGRAHLGLGELDAAALRFAQAVHLDPEHGWAYNNLGFTLLRAGGRDNAEAAVEALTRAAELLPYEASVHNTLGVALERSGRTDAARAAYDRATLLSPRYVKARVNAERLSRVAAASPGPTADEGTWTGEMPELPVPVGSPEGQAAERSARGRRARPLCPWRRGGRTCRFPSPARRSNLALPLRPPLRARAVRAAGPAHRHTRRRSAAEGRHAPR